jgi:hypothetical protein
VRAPPLQAPPPFLIREPRKPGCQLSPLVLRERPPLPPPAIRQFDKTVIVPPFSAPRRSVVSEKYLNLPDRPRMYLISFFYHT